MKDITLKLIDETLLRYPSLADFKDSVIKAAIAMSGKDNKILVCGNGGSSSDGEHIVGELMKEFKLKRRVSKNFKESFERLYPSDGLAEKLQGAKAAINLSSHTSLLTAILNDVGEEYVYAQAVYGYCLPGDVLIAITTSGNADNVINAAKTAKALGGVVIGLTGKSGGRLKDYCDIIINVPQTETYKVQELHLPLYHLLCACVESELWG